MSNVRISLDLTTEEIKTAIEDYAHRKYGYMYANIQPCERVSTINTEYGPDRVTAVVTIVKKDD